MPTPKSEDDRALAEFWRRYVDAQHEGFGYVARHPVTSLRAFGAIRRLPVVSASTSFDTPGAREIRRVIEQTGPLGLPARWWGFAALGVREASLDSPEAKRLRYNLRLNRAAGITCRPVNSEERRSLLELANDRERNHPDPTYRVPVPANDDLLDHDLWMIAENEAGQPLLLAVAATDRTFAVLRYFRTLGDSREHSLSRYLAHHQTVEALAGSDVRWLIDNIPPAAQTNGVRLFQRIVGYRHVRFR